MYKYLIIFFGKYHRKNEQVIRNATSWKGHGMMVYIGINSHRAQRRKAGLPGGRAGPGPNAPNGCVYLPVCKFSTRILNLQAEE